ncbi:hypothetical protein [Arthrobacter cryoconiti]|uniref:Uncharacterized protein n=1 Tax=Arthrobacter cryoconiti TaxID=748907 RepID=A0ABV8R2Q6_9MICC|nr:hypothetical protein [Arthrobacter cryoconiti]MCC9068587.1 hypothetical protein [Arthrobacter cryoconiti]
MANTCAGRWSTVHGDDSQAVVDMNCQSIKSSNLSDRQHRLTPVMASFFAAFAFTRQSKRTQGQVRAESKNVPLATSLLRPSEKGTHSMFRPFISR